MRFFFVLSLLIACVTVNGQQKKVVDNKRNIAFDDNWLFTNDNVVNAEQPSFDAANWRKVTLPHDWSIEDLPNQNGDTVSGPFARASIGKAATGFSVGGTGWYRKSFITDKTLQNKNVTIHFDGVYMNSDVWINGKHVGNHPYGYSPFYYELTPYLKPAGQKNVIVVSVKNEGKNSRWYSGSGIYRHVWLTATAPTHFADWGVFITTPKATAANATVTLQSSVINGQNASQKITLVTTIVSPAGKEVAHTEKILQLTGKKLTDSQQVVLTQPVLWSLEKPGMYKAITAIKSGDKTIDEVVTTFGVRSLQFDGTKGLLLNGSRVILKGGCIHHDNGPLGAAAIDRAEERKIELLRTAGYNAIRCSHNPPSEQLLNACDRLGMLVIDEAFDMWVTAKNPQDYHLYFSEWWQKDLDATILRDRNHPSVIMWSIGNEIFEAADSIGHELSKKLADEVRRLDVTRPVTEAIVYLPGYTKKQWEAYEPNLANIDVDGYNYFLENGSDFFVRDSVTAHRFESEHEKHPSKTFIVTEYTTASALQNWEESVKHPYLLGSFKWTAMDYIGEAGIGRSLQVPQERKLPVGLMRMGLFYSVNWPVFNASCGDLDLVGNRKAASYFQDVVWGKSNNEMMVHSPVADGLKEAIGPWGFPEELKSWSWPGQEGKKMQVHVYTRSKQVTLALNGKVIAQQTIPEGSITATFDVNYEPGTLTATTYDNGKASATNSLTTVDKPFAVRLVADRNTIRASTNDLSYVSVEIVDAKGNVVPYADDTEIDFKLTGNAGIAGAGNGSYSDASSFRQQHKKVYQGKCMVIIRPTGVAGNCTLTATAKGLKTAALKLLIQ